MKRYFRLDENGEWVECDSTDLLHGEKYKLIFEGFYTLISYWYHPDYVEPDPEP